MIKKILSFFKNKSTKICKDIDFENKSAFETDEKLENLAKQSAQSGIDFIQSNFSIKLDYTEESIRNLEKVLDHFSKQKKELSQDQINFLGYSLGNYLSFSIAYNKEVNWGWVTLGKEKFPGIQLKNKVSFWPIIRIFNRIENGSEDNIYHYYKHIKNLE